MSSRKPTNKSENAKTAQTTPQPDRPPAFEQNPAMMVTSAKLFPQKLKHGEVQRLQRAMGNKALNRLLVSKSQQPVIQREGDPFAPFKDKAKGQHDYRLNAEFDPAPKGWTKKQHNNIDYYYDAKKGWKSSLPVIIRRRMPSYEKRKFREAIVELQDKLLSALGGRRGAGFRRADGVFGWRTERAVKRFQKSVKLPESGQASYDTWQKLDQKGSVGVSHGRVSYEYEENLIGSTPGTYGMQTSYGWEEKDKQLDVTVNIKFTNLPGEGANIAKWIQKLWNIFKISYKKDKDGKKTRTKDTSMPLNFEVGLAGGKKKGPTIYPDNQVLLWRGDHPNWKTRNAGWPVLDKKTRSDGGNWNLDDANVQTMVGHEFGHLIGLEDEYARTHADITRLTGKTPLGTDKNEKMTADQKVKYNQLVAAATSTDITTLNSANTLVWGWKTTPNQVEFLFQEYKKQTGNNLPPKFKQQAKDLYDKKVKESPSWSEIWQTHQKNRAAGKPWPGYGALRQQTQKRLAQPAWDAWVGNFPDGVAHKDWWNFWGGSTREYVSGGLMGDYSLLSSKTAEKRPNAVAHTHSHPLEPRHVRRFAEYVSQYKNEVWEAEYR